MRRFAAAASTHGWAPVCCQRADNLAYWTTAEWCDDVGGAVDDRLCAEPHDDAASDEPAASSASAATAAAPAAENPVVCCEHHGHVAEVRRSE